METEVGRPKKPPAKRPSLLGLMLDVPIGRGPVCWLFLGGKHKQKSQLTLKHRASSQSLQGLPLGPAPPRGPGHCSPFWEAGSGTEVSCVM